MLGKLLVLLGVAVFTAATVVEIHKRVRARRRGEVVGDGARAAGDGDQDDLDADGEEPSDDEREHVDLVGLAER